VLKAQMSAGHMSIFTVQFSTDSLMCKTGLSPDDIDFWLRTETVQTNRPGCCRKGELGSKKTRGFIPPTPGSSHPAYITDLVLSQNPSEFKQIHVLFTVVPIS